MRRSTFAGVFSSPSVCTKFFSIFSLRPRGRRGGTLLVRRNVSDCARRRIDGKSILQAEFVQNRETFLFRVVKRARKVALESLDLCRVVLTHGGGVGTRIREGYQVYAMYDIKIPGFGTFVRVLLHKALPVVAVEK